METITYSAIESEADPEILWCCEMEHLVKATNLTSKVLRGVLASLVKKNKIIVEKYEANFINRQYYWTTEQWKYFE